jgi:hypothetical protein
MNYEAGNVDSLFNALEEVIINLKTDRNYYRIITRDYVEQCLDREKIYKPLFDFIKSR